MNKEQARQLVKETFENPFNRDKFIVFIKNLLNEYEQAEFVQQGNYIKDSFKPFINKYERIGKYKDEDKSLDILIVYLKKETSLERARTMQRNFISWYLNGGRGDVLRDAALVAFVSPDSTDWRFSLVKMDYKFETTKSGKIKVKEEFTPARRWSFLVGPNEKSHTAQNRLFPIIEDDNNNPSLSILEEAFNIEKVTKEFFIKYRELFFWTQETLEEVVQKDKVVKKDFEKKNINIVDFSKKLLGQVVFLYFLQKKGWFGVPKGKKWGEGSKFFLRELFFKKHGDYNNFFNDILEPLFYEALRIDRIHDDNYYSQFNCKIPFLNGGLFDPINNYDWSKTDILLPNELFSNQNKTPEGDIGNGILDIFDRYNFTVKEDEPLEKEVAVDPEMLGKVFENLLEVKDRKSKGSYYTPREIVHYMCQQSLINYLYNELNKYSNCVTKIDSNQILMFGNEIKKGQLDILIDETKSSNIPKEEISNLIYFCEQWKENDSRVIITGRETNTYSFKISDNIRKNVKLIDKKLAEIKICDPAVGSGAFPVGMMSEIVKVRDFLSNFINDKNRTLYKYKRECIEKSLYGVDIDPGAVEIAKLRLWLSLIVDEDDFSVIQPLPNLDYKIVCGNSLLGLPDGILLSVDTMKKIEKLKNDHLNITDPTSKNKIKNDIDELIRNLFQDTSVILKNNLLLKFDYHIYFSEVFYENKGFDVLIGNPPYLGERKNKNKFREIQLSSNSKYYLGRMDYFYFFFHVAIDLAKKDGVITFISTNYFPTALGAKKLRTDLKSRTTIIKIVNFNDAKVFDTASGQHNMISIFTKGRSNDLCKVLISRNNGLMDNTLLNEFLYNSNSPYKEEYFIEQNNLWDGKENYLRLTGMNNEVTNINIVLTKILKSSTDLLGNICTPLIGLESSLDDVYVLSWEKALSIIKDNSELNYIKPFFKNSDIERYHIKNITSKYILYLHENIKDIKSLKGIYTYLKENEKKIKSRKGANLRGAYRRGNWWVLNTPRLNMNFSDEKLVTPYRTQSLRFAYSTEEFYASRDVYYIIKKKRNINIKYILALLNSKLYYNWFYYRGKRKGGMLELYAKPLKEVPIKEVDNSIQQKFINLVDKIIESKINNVSLILNDVENQIDYMVYKLYDLTYNEVKIVDPEIEKIISKNDYDNFKF